MPLTKWSRALMEDTLEDLQYFGHITTVLTKVGLVPQLHQLFEERGLQERYLVFDAVELAVGMLTPFRIRHILPYVNDRWQEAEFHPGIVALHGGPRHWVSFQLGLERPDIVKLSRRFKALGKNFRLQPPVWWQYPWQAQDATQPYDFTGDLDKVKLKGLSRNEIWETYIHGRILDRAVEVDYHKMDKEDPEPVLLWETEREQAELTRGIAVLRDMLSPAA